MDIFGIGFRVIVAAGAVYVAAYAGIAILDLFSRVQGAFAL